MHCRPAQQLHGLGMALDWVVSRKTRPLMAGLVRLDSGRLLDEMLGGGASFPAVRGGGFSSLRPMLVDVAERPDCFEMLVDVPGIPKEHISLVVEGQTVTISATPTEEEVAKEAGDSGAGVTWHRIERSTMYVSRGACWVPPWPTCGCAFVAGARSHWALHIRSAALPGECQHARHTGARRRWRAAAPHRQDRRRQARQDCCEGDVNERTSERAT